MFDCEIGLTSQNPQHMAQEPTASKARIENERTFDQPYRGVNVLSEKSECETGKCENLGVVGREPERPESQIDAVATVGLRVVRPVVRFKHLTTAGSQGEGGAIMRIAFYRLPEQVERLNDAALFE